MSSFIEQALYERISKGETIKKGIYKHLTEKHESRSKQTLYLQAILFIKY